MGRYLLIASLLLTSCAKDIYSNRAAGNGTVNTVANAAAQVASGVARLLFSTSPLAFGSVTAGGSVNASVTVTNTGAQAFDFASIVPNKPRISVTSGTCSVGRSLAVGESCTVQLTWNPADTTPLPADAKLEIRSSSNEVLPLTLVGTASAAPGAPAPNSPAPTNVLSFSPNVIDYGDNNSAGTVVTRTVTIRNVSANTLQFKYASTSDGRLNVTGGSCVGSGIITYGTVLYGPFYANAGAFYLAANTTCTLNIAWNVYAGRLADENTLIQIGINGRPDESVAIVGSGN